MFSNNFDNFIVIAFIIFAVTVGLLKFIFYRHEKSELSEKTSYFFGKTSMGLGLRKWNFIFFFAVLILATSSYYLYNQFWGGKIIEEKTQYKNQSTQQEIQQQWQAQKPSVQDETAGWQTYRNEKFGFEIKYPVGWDINGDVDLSGINGGFIIYKKGERNRHELMQDNSSVIYIPFISIGVFKTDLKTGKEFADKYNKDLGEGLGGEVPITGEYEIDGILGVWRKNCLELASQQGPVVVKNGYAYDFGLPLECIATSGPGKIKSQQLVDFYNNFDQQYKYIHQQILSTFKFINQQQVEDWKLYRNEEYGFQLTFSDDWKGYRVVEEINDKGVNFSFEMPTDNKLWENGSGYVSIFVVGVIPVSEWRSDLWESMAHNDKYYFMGVSSSSAPRGFRVPTSDPLFTFKLIE